MDNDKKEMPWVLIINTYVDVSSEPIIVLGNMKDFPKKVSQYLENDINFCRTIWLEGHMESYDAFIKERREWAGLGFDELYQLNVFDFEINDWVNKTYLLQYIIEKILWKKFPKSYDNSLP